MWHYLYEWSIIVYLTLNILNTLNISTIIYLLRIQWDKQHYIGASQPSNTFIMVDVISDGITRSRIVNMKP